jgi:hypothetical protein
MPQYLVTKDQLLRLYSAWDVLDAIVPAKGTKTVIAFPPPADFTLGIITKDEGRSTYGKTLYRVELQSAAPAAV